MQKSQNKKPNLFLVGQPKSGTTALYEFLKQHPEIFFSEDKEPHFFCKDLNQKLNIVFPPQKYMELFKTSQDEKYREDASVHYLYSGKAADEIRKFNPNSKIIIILREPIDFLISWYQWSKHSYIREGASSFKEALDLEEKRKNGSHIKVKKLPVSQLFYSEKIKYSKQIERYLNNFPKKNILILIYEDFKKDNLKYCKKVFDFLNVDSKFNPRTYQRNISNIPRSICFKWFTNLFLIRKTRETIRRKFPNIYNYLYRIYSLFLYKNQNKVQINPKLRRRLKNKFKPEVEKTNKLLNEKGFIQKDLIKFWGYDKISRDKK